MNKFYEILTEYYDKIFPFDASLIDLIKNDQGPQTLLDLGCATGELCLHLSAQGWKTTGIDLDEKMIRLARKKAIDKHLGAEFQHIDILEYLKQNSPGSYDQVVCFGNTLVHLLSEDDLCETISLIYDSLRTGGKFVGQILNYDRILTDHISELPDIDTGELLFQRSYLFVNEGEQIEFNGRLFLKQEDREYSSSIELRPIRTVRTAKLISLLEDQGFKSINIYASPDRDIFSIDKSMAVYFSCNK